MTSSSRILIVDDDPQVAAALELILSAGDFKEIAMVADAEDAFDFLDLKHDDPEVPPAVDVILLDVMMPGIDGIEACARIRQTRRYRDIPILMCTGLGEVNALNQAFVAGAHDYLAKPIRKVELLARVRSAMRFKREIDRRRAREAQLRGDQRTDSGNTRAYFDDDTGLPKEGAFDAVMRTAIASERPHALLALQILETDRLAAEEGPDAVRDRAKVVAHTLTSLRAPLGWRVYLFGDGLFLIVAQDGSLEQVDRFGREAVAAVAALRLAHGHSLVDDFVRLGAASGHGQGTELLTLPATLINALASQQSMAIGNRMKAA